MISEGLKLNHNPVNSQDVACGLCFSLGSSGVGCGWLGAGMGVRVEPTSVLLARDLSLWRHLLVNSQESQLDREAGQMDFFALRNLISISQTKCKPFVGAHSTSKPSPPTNMSLSTPAFISGLLSSAPFCLGSSEPLCSGAFSSPSQKPHNIAFKALIFHWFLPFSIY